MNSKILVTCAISCIISFCCGDLNGTVDLSPQELSNETLESVSHESSDLEEDASLWRLMRPFRNWGSLALKKKLNLFPFRKESERDDHDGGHYINRMYYVDSQKTLLRRDSSFIRQIRRSDVTNHSFRSDSLVYAPEKPRGMVQKEIVSMMLESMLGCIIESWEPISPPKVPDDSPIDLGHLDYDTVGSTATVISLKKKKSVTAKLGKSSRKSRIMMKIDLDDELQEDTPQPSAKKRDERAIIRFRNGNLYEGNTLNKIMNGEGRYQWSNGTVYLGHFKDNEIAGIGTIQWKDDTWYQGEFSGNLRHGKGLYVDSRLQRSYAGEWHYGTKHGKGIIYYSNTFKNSYDGDWIMNERHGKGVREYCALSGYIGDWKENIREGKGRMIWSNNDCYQGEWKRGVMSGNGFYIWDACFNNTMSLPCMKAYRGSWKNGTRHGYGVLNFGSSWGSFYRGKFENNKKNGEGVLVTNNGVTIASQNLFVNDIVGPRGDDKTQRKQKSLPNLKCFCVEPLYFDIEDSKAGLDYHINAAFNNFDKRELIIKNMVCDYLQNNERTNKNKKIQHTTSQNIISKPSKKDLEYSKTEETGESDFIQDFFTFEEISLHKAIVCYISDLKNIYYTYAKICNTEEIYFTPVMIRLYLWQLYYDCKIHEKGLTLYDIDILYYQNRDWLAIHPHDPFETIYFWQFLNSLISVATKLYAKIHMPGPRPDTVVASAVKTFIENDLLPNSNRRYGRLVNHYGSYVPLKATYALYTSLGEPHTIRTFIRSLRYSLHFLNRPGNKITDAPEKTVPHGRNLYEIGDDMIFCHEHISNSGRVEQLTDKFFDDKKLFNLANVPIRKLISIFHNIFPQVKKAGKIMDLEINITFFEFFEVFIECVEESIRLKDEDIKWKPKIFVNESMVVPNCTPDI